jgi:RHS repeat-associated protein
MFGMKGAATVGSFSQSYSQGGRVTGGNNAGVVQTFGYDGLGRLTAASQGGDTWGYGFGASASCPGSAAGRNSNRMTASSTVAGVTAPAWSGCYDTADRQTTGGVVFDDHGNVTTTGTGGSTVVYDAADRATGITTAGVAVLVALDPLGRQIYRQEGSLGYKRRGYAGPGDSLSWTVSSATQIQRQVPLPGGVVLTAETGVGNKWSVPNMHGDIAWVTDQTGTVTGGPYRYDPFGKPLGTRVGVNVIEAVDYGWLGSHQRLNEEASGLTWMGARIYQPTTGRFLSADPVENGSCNDYEYTCADPVNNTDLDGRCFVVKGNILPCGGEVPFKAPKNFNPKKPKRGETKGIVDADGNEWVWDPNKVELDVQTPKPRQPGKWDHTNVGEDGDITHGPNNVGRIVSTSPSTYSYLGQGGSVYATTIEYGTYVFAGGFFVGIIYWMEKIGSGGFLPQ